MGKQNATPAKIWHFNLKMSDDERNRIERLREAIQQRLGANVRVSQKTVILEALERLEAYYAKLERDKQRER
jgi:hypothetical protein